MIELLKKFPLLGRLARLPFLSRAYHYSLSFLGALRYGFPSRRLIVIGVTGTKGKTTTAHLLAQLLQSSGRPAGLATTVLFRIGDREWVNATKQTMPGRFALQGLLRRSGGARNLSAFASSRLYIPMPSRWRAVRAKSLTFASR